MLYAILAGSSGVVWLGEERHGKARTGLAWQDYRVRRVAENPACVSPCTFLVLLFMYLHQAIAIQRSIDEEAARALGSVKRLLNIGGDADPLTGISRVYQPLEEGGEELPPQSRRVQVTAAELIDQVNDALTKVFSLKLVREVGNCEAKADITVDGQVLLADAPVGWLMYAEAQLGQIIGLIDAIPVLNPADEWSDTAPGLRDGVWQSAPKTTSVPRRVPEVQVLYPATPEHPAQVRAYEIERTVGHWITTKYSGQMNAKDRQALRARAVRVLEATRKAREQANRLEVTDRSAAPLLSFIFGE